MKKILDNRLNIILLLCVLLIVQTCTINNNIKKNKQDLLLFEKKFQLHLQLEGLKSERRMIQSTDRKILDVNRAKELENEIKLIEQQLK